MVYGNNIPVIEVSGEIDHYCAPQLENDIKQAIGSSPNKSVVVDLADVGYLDSAGIGVLFAAIDEIKKISPGKSLYIVCINSNVRKILELVGIQTDPTFIMVEQKKLALEQAEGGIGHGE
jgi:anti-anti-sigma factor